MSIKMTVYHATPSLSDSRDNRQSHPLVTLDTREIALFLHFPCLTTFPSQPNPYLGQMSDGLSVLHHFEIGTRFSLITNQPIGQIWAKAALSHLAIDNVDIGGKGRSGLRRQVWTWTGEHLIWPT